MKQLAKAANNFGGGNGGISCPVDIQSGCVVGYACDYRGELLFGASGFRKANQL